MAADNVFLTEMGVSREPEPSPAFRKGDFATVSGTDAGNGAVLEKNLNAEDVTIQVITLPGLTINDLTIVEGDAGTVDAVSTVSLEANGNPVSVDFVTEDLTAESMLSPAIDEP